MILLPKKGISLKNYIYLLVMIVLFLGSLYYLYAWFIIYKNDLKNGLIISSYIQGINYNDLENYIVENDNVTLYVFSTDNEYNNDFENMLTNIIVDNNLQKKLIYLDVSDNFNDGKYNITNIEFKNTPLFVTFNSGEIINSYDVKTHNYDINKVENYLESVGVITDD